MKVTILGCGYSGTFIARGFQRAGRPDVLGTRRSADGVSALQAAGVAALPLDGPPSAAVIERLGVTTHLVSSVAPARGLPLEDPMLELLRGLAAAGRVPALRWIGYLSTIGVYGDHGGARVDEDSETVSMQPRSLARREAERGWQAFGRTLAARVSVQRLAGIYGPGRNAVRDALERRARVLVKPGQVFNRIHVDDLACAVRLAAELGHEGVLNVCDDEPAAPEDVVRFAHELTARPMPPLQDIDTAEDLSPMARSFYAENKRCDNARSKRELGLRYRYPTYREGLAALVPAEVDRIRQRLSAESASTGSPLLSR